MVETKNSIVLDPEDFSKWTHGARVKAAQKLEHLFQWAAKQAINIHGEFFVISTTECPIPNCKAGLEKECELIAGGNAKYANTDLRLHEARIDLIK
jgi:hypothetical protein